MDPELFNSLSASKEQSLVRNLAIGLSTQTKFYSGPLPDPETLQAYTKLIRNGGERIMVMAEKEQQKRHFQKLYVDRRMLNQSFAGQLMGFILCIIAICGGIYLSKIGKDTAGIAAIITALVALAGAFFYIKRIEDGKV